MTDRTPNDTEVICPDCTHQFRAIPVQVQGLLKAAGYEPPFLVPTPAASRAAALPADIEYAIETAIIRFELLARDRKSSAVDPAAGATELREVLAALEAAQPASPAPLTDERERFEAWAIGQNYGVDCMGGTRYAKATENAWTGWQARAALASPQVAPQGQYFSAYLCRAWGETDLPAVELARDLAAVRAFMVREWLGSEDKKDGGGDAILPGVMQEIEAHDWREEPEWSALFEIGGVSVERVTGRAAPVQVAPAPKPMDDPQLQQWFGDAIEGAMAFGFMGNNPPPEGHWLARFWDIGRAEATKTAAPAPKPVAWQERQQTIDGWTSWYAVEKPGAALSEVVCGIEYQWRPLFAAPVPTPAAADDAAAQKETTYSSTQATNCAGCGKRKHTPLRIDAMGGYVCLTCIDQKLGSLLGEFGYPEPEAAADDARDAAELWTLVRRMVALHEEHGTILTVDMGALAEMVAEHDSTPAAKPAEPTQGEQA